MDLEVTVVDEVADEEDPVADSVTEEDEEVVDEVDLVTVVAEVRMRLLLLPLSEA